HADPLDGGAALALMQHMAEVFTSVPRRVTATTTPRVPELLGLMVEFEAGVASLSLWAGPADAGRAWVEVEGEGGSLRAEMPRRLAWRDADGRHQLELPGGLAEVWVIARFVRAVRDAEWVHNSFERAHQALTWLRAARASREKAAPVDLTVG